MNKLIPKTGQLRHFQSRFTRAIHFGPQLAGVFLPDKWADPIVDRERLKQPLQSEDPRRYLFIKPMKNDETPVFYRDPVLDKMIRVFMYGGNKEFIRYHVFEAFELVKRMQYRAWKRANTDEERKDIILDPYILLHKALFNFRPVMKMLPVTRGGTTYSVPWPIGEKEAEFRAMKFLKKAIRDQTELATPGTHSFRLTLAREIIAGSKNEGITVKAKQEHHKLCEANRAFTHYRR